MSATIPDDSEIIRTFDATSESLMNPLSSKSLAGVSERMILAPELLGFKVADVLNTVRAPLRERGEEKESQHRHSRSLREGGRCLDSCR